MTQRGAAATKTDHLIAPQRRDGRRGLQPGKLCDRPVSAVKSVAGNLRCLRKLFGIVVRTNTDFKAVATRELRDHKDFLLCVLCVLLRQ